METKACCQVGVLLIFQLYSSQNPDSDTLKVGLEQALFNVSEFRIHHS